MSSLLTFSSVDEMRHKRSDVIYYKEKMAQIALVVLPSKASPISIEIAATSRQDENETTKTIPAQVDNMSLNKPQRTFPKLTSWNKSDAGTGGDVYS